jgi:hypothetical protein
LVLGSKFGCWNRNCLGHLAHQESWKNLNGQISIKSIQYRTFEDNDTHGFLIFPLYCCGVCGLTKSGTDPEAVSEMGLPPHMFRYNPVVCFKKSAWSARLFEMVNTMMTGRLGSSEIRMLLIKLRTAKYIKAAAFYLELQIYEKNKRSMRPLESYGFGGNQAGIPEAHGYPKFTDHCGSQGFITGFGGKMPPSSGMIADIFEAGMTNVKKFAFQLEASLGGEVIKTDHTHNLPGRILAKSTEGGESIRPAKALMSG